MSVTYHFDEGDRLVIQIGEKERSKIASDRGAYDDGYAFEEYSDETIEQDLLSWITCLCHWDGDILSDKGPGYVDSEVLEENFPNILKGELVAMRPIDLGLMLGSDDYPHILCRLKLSDVRENAEGKLPCYVFKTELGYLEVDRAWTYEPYAVRSFLDPLVEHGKVTFDLAIWD
jgi:hypothetical protein